MSIVVAYDFKEQYKLGKDCFTSIDLQIAKYEKMYLLKLLGSQLYDLFIADLTVPTPQVPQAAIYEDIFDPFHVDNGSCVIVSDGIKQMLIQFIYYHVTRDQLNIKSATGVVRMENEVSKGINYSGFNLIEAYNEAVNTFDAIQWFIMDNESDYPLYNGQNIGYIY